MMPFACMQAYPGWIHTCTLGLVQAMLPSSCALKLPVLGIRGFLNAPSNLSGPRARGPPTAS